MSLYKCIVLLNRLLTLVGQNEFLELDIGVSMAGLLIESLKMDLHGSHYSIIGEMHAYINFHIVK